jgi:16S rRNA processing protein RimM
MYFKAGFMLKKEDLIKIGHFVKPHGIKGEISLLTDYEIADLSVDDPYLVCDMEGIPVPFFIESCRQKNKTTVLVGLADIDSKDRAKLFTGKPAYVPSELLPSGDEDRPEWNCLTGYTVTDDKTGKIGTVSDIDSHTINVLLTVDCKGKDILIPAALITALDRERKTIAVSLPEGFWEI